MLNQIGRPYTEKIAVIGAGPAGLSCAYYLAVKGYPVTVFEKEDKLGGMLTLGIPGFRLDKAVVNAEIDILRELGVEFKPALRSAKDVSAAAACRGLQGLLPRHRRIQGRKARCSRRGLRVCSPVLTFLRDVNLEKPVSIGKRVAVVGGGNVAIDVARTALRLGAEDVTIVYRRSRDEMPAAADEIAEAEEEGVRFMYLAAPVEGTRQRQGQRHEGRSHGAWRS